MTATPTEGRAPLPAIKCTPWCEERNGHTDAGHPDDQYCSAGYVDLELKRDPEQLVSDGPFYRRNVTMSLQCDPFAEPFVSVYLKGTRLMLAEARQIGEYLVGLADIGESATEPA